MDADAFAGRVLAMQAVGRAAGAIVEVLTRESENPLLWWSEYHHVIGHNIGFAVALTIATLAVLPAAPPRRRAVAWPVAASRRTMVIG